MSLIDGRRLCLSCFAARGIILPDGPHGGDPASIKVICQMPTRVPISIAGRTSAKRRTSLSLMQRSQHHLYEPFDRKSPLSNQRRS